MVFTRLDGKVAPEHWDTLKRAFRAASEPLPEAIYQSYLIQDANDQEAWRVVTVWHSRQALRAYRDSVDTPEGILMFRAVGVEPVLSIYDVVDYAHGDAPELGNS